MQTGIQAALRGTGTEITTFAETGKSSHLVSHCKLQSIEVAMFGYLYYRNQLASKLGESPQELASLSAAACVAHLVARHGVSALEKLEGEFSLVLLERSPFGSRLIAARDPNGAFPLFFTFSDSCALLSSSLRQLAANSRQGHLNRDYLAEYLLTPGSLSEMDSTQCVWQGIERIRPGEIIAYSLSGQRLKRAYLRRDYWSQLPGNSAVANEHELAECYRSTLASAVAERIQGRSSAVHLSGGLDSTSVAYLAGNQSGQATLPAISLVFEKLDSMRKETAYIDAALAQMPKLSPVQILGDNTADFELLGHPAFQTEEPYSGVWRAGLDQLTIDAAAAHESEILLTGIGGDETLDRCPYHIADCLRRFQPIHAWKLACDWARHYKWNPWNVFYPFGLANIAPVSSRMGWAKYLHVPVAGLASANEWELPNWLPRTLSDALNLKQHGRNILTRELLADPTMAVSVALCAVRRRAGNMLGWALGVPRGLIVSHPMLDPRVVSIAIAWHRTTAPQPGRLKPLLLKAFEDALPSTIANRRSKGGWNEPFYTGLRKNLPQIKRLIKTTDAPLGPVNEKQLLQDLDRASLGLIAPRKLQILLNYLGLLHWVAQQERLNAMTGFEVLPRSESTGGATSSVRLRPKLRMR